jgi:uncharacterized membrane protein YbhN (UPF0104 family)
MALMLPRGRWRTAFRLIVGAAVVAGVAYHFAGLLGRAEVWERTSSLDWGALLGGSVLYAAGLATWGLFWALLVRRYHPSASYGRLLGAYMISHVAKYVPGKALVIVVRAGQARPAGVGLGVCAATSVFVTLTVMGFGAVLAATGLALTGMVLPNVSPTVLAAGAVAGIVLLLVVFNRAAAFVVRRRAGPKADPKGLPWGVLLEGLVLATAGWLMLGGSLGLSMTGIVADCEGLALKTLPRLAATTALATVGGFVVLPAPGGLGVREALLQWSLVTMPGLPNLDEGTAAVVAIGLRLVWATTEVALAVGLLAASRLTGGVP